MIVPLFRQVDYDAYSLHSFCSRPTFVVKFMYKGLRASHLGYPLILNLDLLSNVNHSLCSLRTVLFIFTFSMDGIIGDDKPCQFNGIEVT